MPLAILDHTVLPATRRKWTHPASTPVRQAGTRSTYPGVTEGWVDLGVLLYIPRWFTRLQTVTHPSTNRAQCWLTTCVRMCRRREQGLADEWRPWTNHAANTSIRTWRDCWQLWPQHSGYSCCQSRQVASLLSLTEIMEPIWLNCASPKSKLSYFFLIASGSRTFHISLPKTWNSLPPHILQSQTLSSFRRHLKTHYFQSTYPAPYRPSPMRLESWLSSENLALYKSLTYLLTYYSISKKR